METATAEVETPFDQEQTLADLEATFELPPDTSLPPVPTVAPEQLQMQLYGTTIAKLDVLKVKCGELDCSTPKRYDETRRMIALLRTTRTRIEKRRKERNQEHQDAIRFTNDVAKQLTNYIANLEDPLKQLKLEVDEAKERQRKAAEEAEKAAAEAKAKAEYEAQRKQFEEEQRQLAQERAEMAARLAEERKAMEAERAKFAAERAAAEAEQRQAREKIDAERRAIEAAKAAAAQAERDRLAAEAAAAREVERQAELERRRAALAPDVEKLKLYAELIRALAAEPPQVTSEDAQRAVYDATEALAEVAASLVAFKV